MAKQAQFLRTQAQQRGRASQSQGSEFERQIAAECRHLHQQGLAQVDKIGDPLSRLKKYEPHPLREPGLARYPEGSLWVCKSRPSHALDFVGVLDGGRMVTFDAKSSDQPDFLFTRISDSQVERARRFKRLGALVFFLVEHRRTLGGVRYIIPVGLDGELAGVRHRRCLGADLSRRHPARVQWADLEPYRERPGDGTWLGHALRLDAAGLL